MLPPAEPVHRFSMSDSKVFPNCATVRFLLQLNSWRALRLTAGSTTLGLGSDQLRNAAPAGTAVRNAFDDVDDQSVFESPAKVVTCHVNSPFKMIETRGASMPAR